jgi:hypothetical protein
MSNTLDLHGTKHANVEDKLSRFFFWEQPGYKQYKIITGNSKRMQDLVIEWLVKHEYSFYIPSHNLGEIQVSE